MKRSYNKFYIQNNRTEGSEKIILGYFGSDKEILLKADQETGFHVPYFITNIPLNESTLYADGATPGPFPAAADKIFENRKGYGESTVNGEPLNSDGTWFCSWLSGSPDGTTAKWVDRNFDGTTYTDVDTNTVLTSGVQYTYLHVGEKTAKSVVDGFAGDNADKLKLNLENWSENVDTIDSSLSSIPIVINHDGVYTNFINVNFDASRVNASSISFDNTYTIECYVPWQQKINLENEFTWMFWAKSKSWQNSQSTQLLGNFSSQGGVGLFIDTLSSYPFFVIPAISNLPDSPKSDIGHLLYINEAFDGYFDKQLTESKVRPANIAKPEFICLDSDNNVVVLATDRWNISLRKYDNRGRILRVYNLFNNLENSVQINELQEYPVDLFCANIKIGNTRYNDVYYVVTNKARYIISNNLDGLIGSKVVFNTSLNSKTTFGIIQNEAASNFNEIELINVENIISKEIGVQSTIYTCISGIRDFKIDKSTRWIIANDGNLYKSVGQEDLTNNTSIDIACRTQNAYVYEKYAEFEGGATNFALDPYERLWVLHGTNKVSAISANIKPINGPLFRFECGTNLEHTNKNISFICCTDRKKQTKEWKCLIYYGDSGDPQVGPQVYTYLMSGKLDQTVDLLSVFSSGTLKSAEQTIEQFQFSAKGDFTGYERRRIFNKSNPYNNKPQLILKAHFNYPKTTLSPRVENNLPVWLEKKLMPIDEWGTNSWQLVHILAKNSTTGGGSIALHINGDNNPGITIDYGQHLQISLEHRPGLYIGTPLGSESGFNKELKYPAAIFNGIFEDVKIYDYALPTSYLKLFKNKAYIAEDLRFNITTPALQYTEQIERMFKHKIPGAKSSFFNIKITGSSITDSATKLLIEQEIRKRVQELKPMHTDFLNIIWVD